MTKKVDRRNSDDIIQLIMALSDFLNSLGIDEKGQKVYLALLALTDAPVSNIAKKSGLERTTAYHHLEKLLKLGLVSTYRNKNTKRFVAENPNKIKGIIEGQMALVDRYLPELQKISSSKKIASLKLFEGVEGRKQLAEEELNCKEKIVRSLGSVKDLRKSIGGKLGFTQKRLDKKVFSKCLRPANDEFEKGWIEDQVKELREVKLLPEGTDATGMMFLFDNKISFIAPHEEEGVGFLIESDGLSKTMKSVFDALWKISKDTKS